ncbi:MAG: GDP-mannose 4,6-dehydratase [Candidatus Nitrosopolaris sp.]
MRVLVTGGTGFVGSELLLKLQERGYDVYSLERHSQIGSSKIIENRRYEIKQGDIKKACKLTQIIREIQPDVVIHLAALSSVQYSYDHPIEYIDTNLVATINLAETCRREVKNFRKMIFTSSLYVYKDTPKILQKEDSTPEEPNSPYGITKLAAEKYLLSLSRNHKFPAFILRPSNIYGRKTGFDPSIVEKLITQMLQAKDEVDLGSPEQIRDFLYISDLVNACIKLMESTSIIPGQIFNISTSTPTTLLELADKVAEHTEFKNKIRWNSSSIPSRPGDPKWLVADNTKAKNMLGWEHEVSLDDGIQQTIAKCRR